MSEAFGWALVAVLVAFAIASQVILEDRDGR